MLVLSRRKNESIIINDNIKIVVISIRGDRVRLGIEAPRDVPVHRREVFELIRKKGATAVQETAAPPSSQDNGTTTSPDVSPEPAPSDQRPEVSSPTAR